MKKKILITGGSGTIGTKLSQLLSDNGYEVKILSRNPDFMDERQCFWDVAKRQIDEEVLYGVHGLIHLAGANIGEKRWDDKRKVELHNSRIKSLDFLYEKFEEIGHYPKVIVSSSGVGFYGAITTEKIFEENDLAGNDFLGQLCKKWEQSAINFENKDSRVVILRTAVVLSNEKNGALQKMLPPFNFGLGSVLASGKQYMPWIHLDDIVQLYFYVLENQDLAGIFNAAAPQHTTNQEFSQTLAKVLGKPFIMPPIPRFLFKIIFGEMEQLVTQGSRVSSDKILASGFEFKYNDLEKALSNLLN